MMTLERNFQDLFKKTKSPLSIFRKNIRNFIGINLVASFRAKKSKNSKNLESFRGSLVGYFKGGDFQE